MVGSNPIGAIIVAIILYVLGLLVVRRVTEAEGGDQWLRKALTVCLILHLVAAPLQIWLVNHLYGGVADYNRYDHQGAILAGGFRHFDFNLAPAGLGGIVSNGSVSIVAGVVFAIVGTNQASAFLVMSWLSFIGILFFYRAFLVTFNGKGNRRYGYLVFFLPTLVLWTSDVSKEAMMVFLLGMAAYGCARILAGQATFGSWLLIVIVKSLRNLRILPRASLARPYLIMCTLYVAAFCYYFAALGNLGLITREATVNLPFLLVLLCIPRGPRGQPPRYVWELRRGERAARRKAAMARVSFPTGRAGG